MSDQTSSPDVYAPLPACMGGWCQHREHCARHLTDERARVEERACRRGLEQPVQVRLMRTDVRSPPRGR